MLNKRRGSEIYEEARAGPQGAHHVTQGQDRRYPRVLQALRGFATCHVGTVRPGQVGVESAASAIKPVGHAIVSSK